MRIADLIPGRIRAAAHAILGRPLIYRVRLNAGLQLAGDSTNVLIQEVHVNCHRYPDDLVNWCDGRVLVDRVREG